MSTEGFTRKITAIMSADVVGYSKLMGDDEAATVQSSTVYKSVMSTLIDQHLETKLPLGYEFLGEKEVKNIDEKGGIKVIWDNYLNSQV